MLAQASALTDRAVRKTRMFWMLELAAQQSAAQT